MFLFSKNGSFVSFSTLSFTQRERFQKLLSLCRNDSAKNFFDAVFLKDQQFLPAICTARITSSIVERRASEGIDEDEEGAGN